MSKRIVVGAVIIAGVVLAAEPIVASFMVQDEVSKITQGLNEHPMFTVVDSSYEKGLFGGAATTTIHLLDAPEGSNLTLKHDISTVPVINLPNGETVSGLAHIRTTLVLDDVKDREEMMKAFSGAEPAIDTVVSYNNDYKVYFNVPELSVDNEVEYIDPLGNKAKKQISVQFSGMNSDINVSSDGGLIGGVLDIPLFAVKESHASPMLDIEFKLENIKSSFNAKRITKNYYSGDGSLDIAQIDISNAMFPITLSKSNISYRLIDKKETFDYEIDSSIEKINSTGGIPIPINQLSSKFAMRNLDVQAFEQYMEVIQNEIGQGKAPDLDTLMPKLMSVGDQFLARNLIVEEVLDLGTEQGAGKININVDFKALDKGMSIQTMNPSTELLPRASADVKVSLPKQVLAMTPFAPQIQQFVGVGYVIEDENTYSSHAQFKDMKLTVNDKPIDIPLPGTK